MEESFLLTFIGENWHMGYFCPGQVTVVQGYRHICLVCLTFQHFFEFGTD